MKKQKQQSIEERLERIEQHLANAVAYVARNVNIEGSGFLHFDDWQGKSGHPLWMRNHMIPTLMRVRAETERIQETTARKAKDKKLQACRQTDFPPQK